MRTSFRIFIFAYMLIHSTNAYCRTLSLFAGATISPSTSSNTSISGLTTIISNGTSDSNIPKLGIEYNQSFFTEWFSFSGIFEFNRYKNSSNSDNHFALLVMPRAHYSYGDFTFWGGIGLGAVMTSFGSSFASSGTASLRLSSSTFSFAMSPRVGIDYKIAGPHSLGLQYDFMTFSGSRSGVFTSGTGVIGSTVSSSFTRSWSGISIKYGFEF